MVPSYGLDLLDYDPVGEGAEAEAADGYEERG